MALARYPTQADAEITAMAFDFGTSRIGLAVGQSITGTAQPLAELKARDGIPDWQILGALLQQWRPDLLVVGIPYNMDGSESELSRRAEKFANRLHGRFHLPCYGMDERLSTHSARELVGAGRRDKPVDSVAACLILESWFAGLN